MIWVRCLLAVIAAAISLWLGILSAKEDPGLAASRGLVSRAGVVKEVQQQDIDAAFEAMH